MTGPDLDFDRTYPARFRSFDVDGALADRTREIWGLVGNRGREVGLAFWTHYAASPGLPAPIGAEKLQRLADRELGHIDDKNRRIEGLAWTQIARIQGRTTRLTRP